MSGYFERAVAARNGVIASRESAMQYNQAEPVVPDNQAGLVVPDNQAGLVVPDNQAQPVVPVEYNQAGQPIPGLNAQQVHEGGAAVSFTYRTAVY
jgi:hypothetical protein